MFEAELRHKLPEVESREDYLTSCVFGALKYVSPDRWIIPVLGQAVNYRCGNDFHTFLRSRGLAETDLHRARVYFWPRSSIFGEPDLVFVDEAGEGSFLIAIEVKYFSVKHGEGEDDQLVRYFSALEEIPNRLTFDQMAIRRCKADFTALIYITQHEAETELDQSIGILEAKGMLGAKKKIFHLRWPYVARQVQSLLKQTQVPYEKAIYKDVGDLLSARNLLPFTRFSALPTPLASEPLLAIPVFFETDEEKSRRFNGFPAPPPDLMDALEATATSRNRSSAFSGFVGKPRGSNWSYQDHIFFAGG